METEILETGDILEETSDRFLIGRESLIVIGFLFPSYEFINLPTVYLLEELKNIRFSEEIKKFEF